MKKLLSLTAWFLLCASLLFAQGGKPVGVTAEKEVEIRNNDVAAARTMALVLASRDAVEKAYGTYVKVEQFATMRQVLTQAAAGLQYKILAEQKRGTRYWVKIQASVLVPEQYAGAGEEEREGLSETMKNFVQKYPQGEINWGDGIVLAYGKGEITNAGTANAEALAARAAEVDAKAHLLEIINDIPVDDVSRLGEQKQMAFALEGFVQGAEVVTQSKSGTTVRVTVQAPIRGVKGLTMTIYGYYTPEPPATAEVVEPIPLPEAQVYTGVVIDARKVSVTPALFPKIQDTKKREVHGVSQVNTDDLQKRGMASYAVVARDVQISKLFPHAIVLAISYEPETAPAETGSTKPKRRQGYKPLVVSVVDAGGPLKANLIVSEEDAKKIKAVADRTNVLKECRVVVVVSSEVGGLEGKLL